MGEASGFSGSATPTDDTPQATTATTDRRRVDPWSAALTLALASGLAYLVWFSSCMLGAMDYAWDDNFMTYIYSRNLSQGHGLRYNATDPGPVEGFSSLSHTVAVVSQTLAFLTLATVFHLQSGMETIIFMGGLAALAGWTLAEFTPAAVSPRPDLRRVVAGCLALGFVTVSRPEGPFLVAFTLALVLVARRYLLPGLSVLNDWSFFLVSALSAGGLLAYFCWKKLYFGHLLPNPYYMKANNAIFGSRISCFYSSPSWVALPCWPPGSASCRCSWSRGSSSGLPCSR